MQQSPLMGSKRRIGNPPSKWGEYQFWEVGAYYEAETSLVYNAHEIVSTGRLPKPATQVYLPGGSYSRCVHKAERPLTNPPDPQFTNAFVQLDLLTPDGRVVRVGFFPGVRGDARAFERIDNELLILALAAKGLA